jgi:hypothetical protein
MPLIPITLLATALLAAAPAAETSTPAVVARHSHPVDNGTLSLDTQAGPVRIPIDLRGNHIYMRGRINDSDSLWIVLDSGASGNVVDDEVAKRLGLEITSMGQGRGAGGTVDAGQIRSVSIRLPGATLDGSPIVSMSLGAFKRQTGRPMEAIIGYPLISRCVIKLDYLSRTLELIPAKTFKYQGSGKVVPVTFVQNHPYVTARVSIPGRKEPIKGRFVVDLGSSMALILSPWAIHEYKMNERSPTPLKRVAGASAARCRHAWAGSPASSWVDSRSRIRSPRCRSATTRTSPPTATWATSVASSCGASPCTSTIRGAR